jgi:hypothetical protein
MKKNIIVVLLLSISSFSIAAETDSKPAEAIKAPSILQYIEQPAEGSTESKASASMLMSDCIARFPPEELQLTGRLTMRRRYGIEISEYNFLANVCWGTAEPYATYKFYSLKGELVDDVTIKRDAAGAITLSRNMKTPAGAQIPAPKVNDTVLGSDVTWIDATMDFLWWKNPELVGEGDVKGRDCDIIKLTPPTATQSCSFGKVWLDKAQRVLMQATQNDSTGNETRRLWVRAVQKLEVAEGDERWVIKDLEVETTGSGHRTRLHFDDVKIVK